MHPTNLICTVHDEILLECPDAETKDVSDLLHRCMIAAAQKFMHPIPVLVDVKVSTSWVNSLLRTNQPFQDLRDSIQFITLGSAESKFIRQSIVGRVTIAFNEQVIFSGGNQSEYGRNGRTCHIGEGLGDRLPHAKPVAFTFNHN